MKVTILDFDDIRNPLLNAGQARATFEIGSRLVEKGHKVEVICSKYPDSQDRFEQGIKYTHIGIGSGNLRLNNVFYNLLLPFKVSKLKSDVILECFTPPISTLLSPIFTRIPVVATSTSFEAERFAAKYHLPFDRLEKFFLRFYKYFVPTSQEAETKMKRINPDIQSKTIYLGVDEEYFKVKRRKAKHILFLGRFDIDQKGMDLLFESYSKICRKIDYPLVLAGFGPDRRKVKKLIKKYRLQGKTRLLGPTYGKKKMKVLSEALFFAVPSRSEGFCIAALEAIAAGLPVVSFRIPGLSWIPKSISLKAEPFDTKQLADLMLKACDRKENAKLGKQCQKVAERFSWDKVAERYEKLFKSVISRSRKVEFSLQTERMI